jgi:hypothetical protein
MYVKPFPQCVFVTSCAGIARDILHSLMDACSMSAARDIQTFRRRGRWSGVRGGLWVYEWRVVAARHTSNVTRHTSHVTRHTSHVTRHTSHVTRHTSHVTRHTSHVTGLDYARIFDGRNGQFKRVPTTMPLGRSWFQPPPPCHFIAAHVSPFVLTSYF